MDYPLAAGDPRRIGDYRIEGKLGEGGMGAVFLGRSPGGRAVAVKVIKPELATDPQFRARFRAEVAAVRKVGGFHTAPVVDADPDAEQPWMVSAFIPGPTLGQAIQQEGPFDEEGLRRLGAALAEALGAIHASALVHRDLKPGNIIMAVDGPRVLDFGIARAVDGTRLTHTGAVFGTAGFLAPEQIEGSGEVDGACDVFALGAVLVAAAGGQAFQGATLMSLLYNTVHQEPDLAALPAALRPVLANCLDKDPSRRPAPQDLITLLGPADEGTGTASFRTPTRVDAGDGVAGNAVMARARARTRPVPLAPAKAERPSVSTRPGAAPTLIYELSRTQRRKLRVWLVRTCLSLAFVPAVLPLIWGAPLYYTVACTALALLLGLRRPVRYAQRVTFDAQGIAISRPKAHFFFAWSDIAAVSPSGPDHTPATMPYLDVTFRPGTPMPRAQGRKEKSMFTPGSGRITVCLHSVEKGAAGHIEQRRIRETIELLAPAVDVRRL